MAASLELFRRSGDDLIDRWDGRRLVRAAQVPGGHAPLASDPQAPLAATGHTPSAAGSAAAHAAASRLAGISGSISAGAPGSISTSASGSSSAGASGSQVAHGSDRDAALAPRGWVAFRATNVGTLEAPALEVLVEDASHLAAARDVVASTFVPEPPTYARLLQDDAVLATLNARFPGVRQIRHLDVFTALIRAISAQQVNLRWAATTRRRLAEAFGQRHVVGGETVFSLDPRRIARVDPAEIRALQFTTSKSLSIVAVAQATADGDLDVDRLLELSDDAVLQRLTSIRGIGRWSADWVLARTLGRPRVVAGDLAVRKAVGLAYLGTPLPSEAQVRQVTAHWGASATVAQALLLHALGEGALSRPTSAGPTGRSGSRAAPRP